jgi:hypothetical protein
VAKARRIFVVLGLLLAGSAIAPDAASSAASSKEPNLAYAIAVNVPEFEGQDLPTFACQLCQSPDGTGGKAAADYLVTIDMEKKSATYGEVIARTAVPEIKPELHHMGISADVTRLALYDLYQNEANIFDIATDPRHPAFMKAVDLGEESRELLGEVEGLVDGSGNPVKVGFATPHVSYRMPNGNFMIAMGGAWVPELPDLNLKAPGGFIEMTPGGDVVRAFPEFKYENGKLTNGGLFSGKGVFSVDYNERLGMMAHADLMTPKMFLCGDLALAPDPDQFGTQVALWNFPKSGEPSIFQTIELASPIVTAPLFVDHPINGMDVIYVTTFTSGLWALHRPTGTNQQFVAENIYSGDPDPSAAPHGFVHMRLHPTKDVLYISDPYGDILHVLNFGKDPLAPKLLQRLAVDEIHMMKFSADGKTLGISNGLASILSFTFNTTPFAPEYGLTEAKVNGDGTLAPPVQIFDGSSEVTTPENTKGVFIGDFYYRQSPQPFV